PNRRNGRRQRHERPHHGRRLRLLRRDRGRGSDPLRRRRRDPRADRDLGPLIPVDTPMTDHDAPLTRVIGVVSAAGVSAAERDGGWLVSFTLEAWRRDGGELVVSPLALHRLSTRSELADYFKRVRP